MEKSITRGAGEARIGLKRSKHTEKEKEDSKHKLDGTHNSFQTRRAIYPINYQRKRERAGEEQGRGFVELKRKGETVKKRRKRMQRAKRRARREEQRKRDDGPDDAREIEIPPRP